MRKAKLHEKIIMYSGVAIFYYIILVPPSTPDHSRINFNDCSPKGVINSIKESFNPKKFWVGTYVDLEMEIDEIERYGVKETIEYECVWATYKSKQVMDNCRTNVISTFSNMKSCLSYAGDKCRSLGGVCKK